ELQPDMFVEVSPDLAAERELEHMGCCHVITGRSAVEGRVLVTERLRPLRIDGRVIGQVWLPYHWGSGGLVTGDTANDLYCNSLEPNGLSQETKAGTCDVRPGRRAYVAEYRRRAGSDDGGGAIVTAAPAGGPGGSESGADDTEGTDE